MELIRTPNISLLYLHSNNMKFEKNILEKKAFKNKSTHKFTSKQGVQSINSQVSRGFNQLIHK